MPRGFKDGKWTVLPLVDAPTDRCLSEKELLARLPERCQADPSNEIWKCSTHVFPAAYPRSISERDSSPLMPKTMDVQGVAELGEKYWQRAAQARINTESSCDQAQLYIAINRYRPKAGPRKSGNPVTFVFGHANGMNKESWEVLYDRLFTDSNVNVGEIYSLDFVNHGDSALLNKGNLQTIISWADIARDWCQFVLYYLPQLGDDNVPICLPRQTSLVQGLSRLDSQRETPSQTHWRNHRLILTGSSVGGTTAVCASYLLPSVIKKSIILDPVIVHKDPGKASGFALTTMLSKREFASRQEAIEIWSKDKRLFYGWTPQSVRNMALHGLIQTNSASFKLKVDRMQEIAIYTEGEGVTSFAAFECMRHLSTQASVHIIRSGKKFTVFCRNLSNEEILVKLRDSGANVTLRQLDQAGHLMPQMQPHSTAEEILRVTAGWIREEQARL